MLHADIRNLGQQLLRLLRISVNPRLDLSKQLGATSLNHVTKQRPGRATEPNQGDLASELRPRQSNRIVHIAQLGADIDLALHHLLVLSIRGGLERVGEVRALLVDHLDGHAHGLRDDEDVGEDDGGVDEAGIAADGLESDFGGDFGIAAAFEEVSLALGLVVFREVAASCQFVNITA